jgi:hypothetical protein
MELDNILERVPGAYVSDALRTLPRPDGASVDSMEACVAVPGIGNVRITVTRKRSRKGKAYHYFWTAEKAVLVK